MLRALGSALTRHGAPVAAPDGSKAGRKHDIRRMSIKLNRTAFERAWTGTTGARRAALAAGEKELLSDGKSSERVVSSSSKSLNVMGSCCSWALWCRRNANPANPG